MTTLTYRPDIDGLRGISILLVLAFHLKPELCPGGYTGVDVFLVISGFLITKMLLIDKSTKNSAQEKGNGTLLRFYERRVRRLWPAVPATVVFTSLESFYIHTSPESDRYRQKLRCVVGMVANMCDWSENNNYFKPEDEYNLLSHMWSLSVEEQFYIFNSTLIILFGALSQLHRAIYVYVFIGVGSFSLAVFRGNSGDDGDVDGSNEVFYLTHFRAWELTAGCLIACLEHNVEPSSYLDSVGSIEAKPGKKVAHGRLQQIVKFTSPFGLAGIVLFSFLASEIPYAGGVKGIFAVVGAVLIISGSPKNVSNLLLSHWLLVSIGKISYSLYLVHIPVNIWVSTFDLDDVSFCAAATLLSFVSAIASYHFVEQPFRNANLLSRSTVFVLFLSTAVAVFGASYLPNVSFARQPAPSPASPVRLPVSYPETNVSTLKPLDISAIQSAILRSKQDRRNYCGEESWYPLTTAGQTALDVLIVGDSYGCTQYSGLHRSLEENQLSGVMMAYPHFLPGLSLSDSGERVYNKHGQLLIEFVAYHRPKHILFMFFWGKILNVQKGNKVIGVRDGNGELWYSGYRNLVNEMCSNLTNPKITIIEMFPYFHYDPCDLVIHLLPMNAPQWRYTAKLSPNVLQKRNQIRTALRDIVKSIETPCSINLVDPTPLLCLNESDCVVVENNICMYANRLHLSSGGSLRLTQFFSEIFNR